MNQNLYTIPFEANFLEVFIDECLDLSAHSLNQTIILLPTKRACRTFKEILFSKTSSQIISLPKIITLSDIDLSFLLLFTKDKDDLEYLISLPKKINLLKKFFLLTQMIMKASMLTKSIYQAGKLADDLGHLITQIYDEQCDPKNLEKLVPEKYATHWQKTLDFLKIISLYWPEILKGMDVAEQSDLRNRYLEYFVQLIEQKKMDCPLYILGMNASLPIVKQLISATLHCEKGRYIFQGLDLEKQDNLAESDTQYTYQQLLVFCNKKLSDVQSLCDKKTIPKITYYPCKRVSEETQICGLILRETLAKKNQTCAVVTNNVGLIKHLKAVLKIWDIEINDSSGEPLDQTYHFDFLKLIFETYQNPESKLIFLSFLKHPLCQVGMERNEWLKAIRGLEKEVFRTSKNAIQTIYEWEKNEIFEPILLCFKIHHFETQSIVSWINLTIELLDFFSHDHFFDSETGQYFLTLFEEIKNQGTDFQDIDLSFYLILLEQLIKKNLFYEKKEMHPRLTILGPYEARLQHFDRVIIASCNEENWLSQTTNPFLSQSMAKQFGLPSQEEKQGRAALDFFQLLGNKEVFITRSILDQGSPMTRLRWLDQVKFDPMASQKWFNYLSFFNEVKTITPIQAPEPKPPKKARPIQFSVSDIELLIRDPYSIFAKKILKLRPIDSIEPSFNMSEYGSFIHLFLYHLKQEKPFDIENKILNFPTLMPFKFFFILKLQQIKEAFYYIEKSRFSKTILLEKRGEIFFGKIKITAIADRIDHEENATYEIIDYKTGAPPSIADIQSGYSPQCILEAMILKANGFGMIVNLPINFAFWQIGKSFKIKPYTKQIEEGMDFYSAGLTQLFEAYEDENMPYYAQPFPLKSPKYNDHLHLSRVKEWLN